MQLAQTDQQLGGIWGSEPATGAVDAAQSAVDAAQADLANWQPGSTNRTILTALSVAAGGNVAGGVSGFVQDASLAYLQGQGAALVKSVVDNNISDPATRETTRALLQGVVACAGGAASTSGNCGAQALGASGAVVMNNALNALMSTSTESMTDAEKQQRQDLITSIIAGVAAAAGGNAAAASAGAQTELVNNGLTEQINALAAGLKLCSTQKCRDDYNQAIQDAIHSTNQKTITSYEQVIPIQDHNAYYPPNSRPPMPDYISLSGGGLGAYGGFTLNLHNGNLYISWGLNAPSSGLG